MNSPGNQTIEVPKQSLEGHDVSGTRRKNLVSSISCGLILVLCVIVIHPVVELATNDDWSYAKTAQVFANTGHFAYNGWATAMLGWQVIWGALFIKLFGFSFMVLRISTVLTGVASAFLLHRILLRFGVNSANAMLGTLTVVLSPLILPLTVSFLTDIPSILCILLCLYGCQRALTAESDREALLWLCGSAGLNVLDGTVRQIAWLGTLVMVPSAFWLLRRRPRFPMIGALVWMLSAIGIFLFMRWFQHQPYSLPEHLIRGPVNWRAVRNVAKAIFYVPLDVALFSLPIFIAWLSCLSDLRRSTQAKLLFVAACTTPALIWFDRIQKLKSHLPPWVPNIVSKSGIMGSMPIMGEEPEILGKGLRLIVAVVLAASATGWVISLFRRRDESVLSYRRADGELGMREALVMLVPFCVAYLALLLPRAAFPSSVSDIYDRYFVPLVIMSVILLLRLYQDQVGENLPLSCYATLFLFTFFSVAGTHDVFTGYRAILRAVDEIKAAHISGRSISAGWQYDSWNQVEAQGYLNDDRLINPPGSYHAMQHPLFQECEYVFGPLLSALHPRFALSTMPVECLAPSTFPPVPYRTWLPPYERMVYVQRNPLEP
ncbi:MAG: hypothetical protein JWQ42_3691 [Edaphobacter sp.]|nr:hypothetical protein [Edaphobacter sp.]